MRKSRNIDIRYYVLYIYMYVFLYYDDKKYIKQTSLRIFDHPKPVCGSKMRTLKIPILCVLPFVQRFLLKQSI